MTSIFEKQTVRRLRDEVLRAQLRPVIGLALAAALVAALGVVAQYTALRWENTNAIDDLKAEELQQVLVEARPGQWPQLARWLVQYGLGQRVDGSSHVLLTNGDRVPLHDLVQLIQGGQRLDPITQNRLGPAPPSWLEPMGPGEWKRLDEESFPAGQQWRGLLLALDHTQRVILQAPPFELRTWDLLQTIAALFTAVFIAAGGFVTLFFWLFRKQFAADSAARLALPIEQLADALTRFSVNQREPVEVPIAAPLEVAQLARSANLLQHRLSDTLKELERTNEDQRRFMTDISHELRTPLTVIRGHAERLGRKPDQADSAQIIVRQVEDLQQLLGDLIDLQRIASICASLKAEQMSVSRLLQEMHRRFQAPAWRQGVLLRLDSPPEAWMLKADPRWLRQVLANLLTNAIRHTPPGGWVAISAAVQGSATFIRIDDTGTGMGGAPSSWSEDQRTAGIGLRLVHQLLDGMCGHLRAEVNDEGGTSMVVVFES